MHVVSGYRTYPSGALTAVGTDGDYWSSSPTAAGNANAGNLGFNSGIVNPLNNNNRAFGFTVRCVQHLQGCFFLPHSASEPLRSPNML